MYVLMFFVSIVLSVAVVNHTSLITNPSGITTLTCHIKTPGAKLRWEFIQSDSILEQLLCINEECRSPNIEPDSPYQFHFYQNYYFLIINKVGIEHDGKYYMTVDINSRGEFREVEGCKFLVVHDSKTQKEDTPSDCERAAIKAEKNMEIFRNVTLKLKQEVEAIKTMGHNDNLKRPSDAIWNNNDFLNVRLTDIICMICAGIYLAKSIWLNRVQVANTARLIWFHVKKFVSCRKGPVKTLDEGILPTFIRPSNDGPHAISVPVPESESNANPPDTIELRLLNENNSANEESVDNQEVEAQLNIRRKLVDTKDGVVPRIL